ncbi:gas vesicle protein [Actinomadura mexicana]|uniref:Gas vesicle protein n=1 Tax=Actinomadura mexicana TaxID=134959 RepID=A0A238YKN5_9ACTN|nr:gas vesicle protein [Actinomadura mexicana]SNR71610.1 Gas vesicle protein [Actinomadura mexicana]
MTPPSAPLRPTRDPQVTLDDLLEVVLNKGAVLHLDLIIAVADIPLIGVNLRAAIAGMETMLEYGLLRQWDADTRAWAERATAATPELEEGERVVVRSFGGHYDERGPSHTWRPGTLFLTDRRILVYRREPPEALWEARVEDVAATRLQSERTVGGEERLRVRVELAGGGGALLSAANPEDFDESLRRLAPHIRSREPRPLASDGDAPECEGHVWYHEPRRDGAVWRGGRARLENGRLTWKAPTDARPAVVLDTGRIRDVRLESGSTPSTGLRRLVVDAPGERIVLAAEEASRWMRALAPGPPAVGARPDRKEAHGHHR